MEYALLLVAIAAVIIAAAFALGRLSDSNYRRTCDRWLEQTSGEGAVCTP